jgi:hypothetical protein
VNETFSSAQVSNPNDTMKMLTSNIDFSYGIKQQQLQMAVAVL